MLPKKGACHMGGRGTASASAMAPKISKDVDYSRGSLIAELAGVDARTAAEMYDAVQEWAAGSTRTKNAQRGTGDYTEADVERGKILDEFIEKMPDYQGELIRVINVPDGTKFTKNGKIYSDGSITSWTVPGNLEQAFHGFAKESSGLNVIYHVNATKGADTRGISGLTAQDQEILQARGYDAGLTVSRTKKDRFRSWAFPEGVDVLHVYLKE